MQACDPDALDEAWNFRAPAESETNFRALITQYENADCPSLALEARTQLARALGLQRRFADGHEVLDGVDTARAAGMQRVQVRALLERGRLVNSAGQAENSIPLFEQAFTAAQSAGLEYLAVDAAHMLGIVSTPDLAIGWHERAMQLAETAEDPKTKRWLGPLYNNLAWTYSDLGQHDKALALFEKDIALRERAGQRFEASIARWSKGHTLRKLGQVEAALALQRSLLDHPDRQGNAAEGYTHEEIGECLLVLGDADGAAAHFAKAYERLSVDPWLQENEAERLERMLRLSSSRSP